MNLTNLPWFRNVTNLCLQDLAPPKPRACIRAKSVPGRTAFLPDSRGRTRGSAWSGLVLCLLFPWEALLSTEFTVNRTDDDPGEQTLRSAIQEANTLVGTGPHVINFRIPTTTGVGPVEIHLHTPLPAITVSTTIDARTQPGYAGSPLVALALEWGSTDEHPAIGLHFDHAPTSQLLGLAIYGTCDNLVQFSQSGSSKVEHCWLGMDTDGLRRPGGRNGLQLWESPEKRVSGNQICAVHVNGIYIYEGSGGHFTRNSIGFDRRGSGGAAVMTGIRMITSSGNMIGGDDSADANIVSGNWEDGVVIAGSSRGNRIIGNRIGVAADGMSPSPNGHDGIALLIQTDDTLISRNTIAHNGRNGVTVTLDSKQNLIVDNRIFQNRGLGIDLGENGVTPNDPGDIDGDANESQNYPRIKFARTDGDFLVIDSQLTSTPNTAFQVDFYWNSTADASGHGQGQVPLGSTRASPDGDGWVEFRASFPRASLPSSHRLGYVTATATNPSNNTSEFSSYKKIR